MNAFELLLFAVDPDFIGPAVAAGIDGIIVDLETRGKDERQASADTEINRHTIEDLLQARRSTPARIICRINGLGQGTAEEVEEVVLAGADEILLPMVRRPGEVEEVLDLVAGRCGVGILLETTDAVEDAAAFSGLPITRAYVGLNDLAIERGSPSIFSAVMDGTVERVRSCFDVPFGFGGLTRPEAGYPIPCRLLMGEMSRLGCSFSFLRRSFYRDTAGRDLAVEVPRIGAALRLAGARSPAAVERDRVQLTQEIARASGLALAGSERR